ncbi:MAG TPA: sulfate ABC transporter permease subunit, partial [Candidatus Baltobacteraceae bacterium]
MSGEVALERTASRPRKRTNERRGLDALPVVFAFVLVAFFIALPLASVVFEAFKDGWGAFAATFADGYALSAIGLSLIVTAITVVCNTAFGIIAAWTVTKYRFPGKALLVSAIDLPLTVSPVVAGLAILLAFGEHAPIGAWLAAHGIRVAFAFPGIVLATIFVTFPYVARELIAFMQENGRELEESALLLGAGVWQTLWRVTLPAARWALLDGILLCNARAMGEFGAVSVISGRIRGQTMTVPLDVENLYDDGMLTNAFALALALAVVTIALSLVRSHFQRERKRAEA